MTKIQIVPIPLIRRSLWITNNIDQRPFKLSINEKRQPLSHYITKITLGLMFLINIGKGKMSSLDSYLVK